MSTRLSCPHVKDRASPAVLDGGTCCVSFCRFDESLVGIDSLNMELIRCYGMLPDLLTWIVQPYTLYFY